MRPIPEPRLAEAWLCRGNLFHALKQFDNALAAHGHARQLKPELAEAWIGLGMALKALGRLDEAQEAFTQALALKPDAAEAWVGRAGICST